MRIRVGSTQNEVEVGQYKEINKGALKAFFTLIEYPLGRKTIDCRYFCKGDNRWFSFPQREFKRQGSDKVEYISYISYPDRAYSDQLKEAILTALKEQENGKNQAYQNASDPIQDDSPPLWFG